MPTEITALPTPPSRQDPDNFAARGDAFMGALPSFATEANTLAAEVNQISTDFGTADALKDEIRVLRDDVLAVANATGGVMFYDTKADAEAAVGALSESDIVEVMADESRAGRRARYRVESAALVFKIYPDDTLNKVSKGVYQSTVLYEYAGGMFLGVGVASVAYNQVLYVPNINFTTTGVWLEDRPNLDVVHKQTAQESAYSLPAHRALIPRTSASDLYAFGDSQTAGSNAATGVYYTDGAGVLLPKFKWPNILASMYDNSMQPYNFAVGGQRLGWNTGGYEYSIFNQMGNLGPYSGGAETSYAVAVMAGWNSVNPSSTTEDFYRIVRRSHEANIARLLMDGWGAITHLGWADPNNGGQAGGAFSFATTSGVSEAIQDTVASNKTSFNPFSYGDSAGARWTQQLTNGQYSEVTFGGKRAACVFLETDPVGEGIATISLDDGTGAVDVGTVDCHWTSLFNDDRHPLMFWIEDLPPTATIRVTCEAASGKVVRLLAIGYTEKSEIIARKRTIIYGTMVANSANGHDPETLFQCAKQCEAAVGTFSEYGVLFANPFSHWVEVEDQEPQDISHLTPSGNMRVARAFASAVQLPFVPSVSFYKYAG